MLTKISKLLNKSPLWLSFLLLTSIFMMMLTIILSWSNYVWNRRQAISAFEEKTETLLELKVDSLNSYFDELTNFCIFPVYDTELYSTLLSSHKVSAAELKNLFDSTQIYYYTRSDLESYEMLLLNQDIIIGRGRGHQHLTMRSENKLADSSIVKDFALNNKNGTLLRASTDGSALTFTHSIVRISDHTPVALTSLGLSNTRFRSGNTNMHIVMYHGDGTLIYANDNAINVDNLTYTPKSSCNSFKIIAQDGVDMLVSNVYSRKYDYYLSSFTPISEIIDAQYHIRSFSMMQGLIFLAISLGISFLIVRFLTAPFGQLAIFQKRLGQGDFSNIHIGRSREAQQLSISYNQMIDKIDKLINENLIAQLSINTSRLKALEAQINPHFLYNTLQAIGSDALLNDQFEIYEMITKLAGNFRYVLDKSDTVTISEEISFTQNYVELQKIRMYNRLSVMFDLDEAPLELLIPKCSIQTLVENSIIHGLDEKHTSIYITISIHQLHDGSVAVAVHDNGVGISSQKINELRHSFLQPHATDSSHIGLGNLHARLKLLYHDDASLQIESIEAAGTTITMKIKGVTHVHSPYS